MTSERRREDGSKGWLSGCRYSGMALAAVVGSSAPAVLADESVLGRYLGNWEMRVRTLQPAKPDIVYKEVYQWVLDRRFIQGHTDRKPDGTEDLIYGTYDAGSGGYPFWIFSSSGSYTYLPPAHWDEGKRTMEWKNPSGWDINYFGRCQFPNANERHCSLIMKDWKGKVLLQQEWSATRLNR